MLKQARLLLQIERHDQAMAARSLPQRTPWQAREAFELVTIGAARALGMEGEVGSLAVGKRADIVIALPNSIMATPVGDPVATLLFYTNPSDIKTVLVAGDVKKRNGCLVGVDRMELATRAEASADAIRSRMANLSCAAMQQVWAGMF